MSTPTATDPFQHHVTRLVRGTSYAKRANKLNLAMEIITFNERKKAALDAVKSGNPEVARKWARRAQSSWSVISQWLKA